MTFSLTPSSWVELFITALYSPLPGTCISCHADLLSMCSLDVLPIWHWASHLCLFSHFVPSASFLPLLILVLHSWFDLHYTLNMWLKNKWCREHLFSPVPNADVQRETCLNFIDCPMTHSTLLLFSGERKETNSLQGLSNKLNTHKPVLHIEWLFTVLILQNEIECYPSPVS